VSPKVTKTEDGVASVAEDEANKKSRRSGIDGLKNQVFSIAKPQASMLGAFAFPSPVLHPLPLEALHLPIRLRTRRVTASTLPRTSHPCAEIAQHVARVCQFRAREADVGGCRLGIPCSCNERFGTVVGERGPARASGFEQIPGGVDVLAS
jgi:hypothetical protein